MRKNERAWKRKRPCRDHRYHQNAWLSNKLCLVSFVLPIALGALDGEQTVFFLKGTLLGILTLPLGLIVGGVLT